MNVELSLQPVSLDPRHRNIPSSNNDDECEKQYKDAEEFMKEYDEQRWSQNISTSFVDFRALKGLFFEEAVCSCFYTLKSLLDSRKHGSYYMMAENCHLF